MLSFISILFSDKHLVSFSKSTDNIDLYRFLQTLPKASRAILKGNFEENSNSTHPFTSLLDKVLLIHRKLYLLSMNILRQETKLEALELLGCLGFYCSYSSFLTTSEIFQIVETCQTMLSRFPGTAFKVGAQAARCFSRHITSSNVKGCIAVGFLSFKCQSEQFLNEYRRSCFSFLYLCQNTPSFDLCVNLILSNPRHSDFIHSHRKIIEMVSDVNRFEHASDFIFTFFVNQIVIWFDDARELQESHVTLLIQIIELCIPHFDALTKYSVHFLRTSLNVSCSCAIFAFALLGKPEALLILNKDLLSDLLYPPSIFPDAESKRLWALANFINSKYSQFLPQDTELCFDILTKAYDVATDESLPSIIRALAALPCAQSDVLFKILSETLQSSRDPKVLWTAANAIGQLCHSFDDLDVFIPKLLDLIGNTENCKVAIASGKALAQIIVRQPNTVREEDLMTAMKCQRHNLKAPHQYEQQLKNTNRDLLNAI